MKIHVKNGNEMEQEESSMEAEDSKSKLSVVAQPAQTNLEDAFQDIFKTSQSGSGEEELLRIASQFSLQITAPQIKCLLYILHRADTAKETWVAERLRSFVRKWLEYKQNNNSDIFVMKALEHISLRHFINENSMKINIDKG